MICRTRRPLRFSPFRPDGGGQGRGFTHGLVASGSAVALAVALLGCAPGDVGSPGSDGTGGVAVGSGGAGTGGTGAAGVGQGGSVGSVGSAGSAGAVGPGGGNSAGGTGFGTGGAGPMGGAGGRGTGGGAGRAGIGGQSGTGGTGQGTGGGVGAGGSPVGAVPLNPSLLSLCTGTNPITCTIPVPANGDYNVTVELGDAAAASMSRVQAELLRIVVPQLSLPAGQFSQLTFSVNVRPEVHDGYAAPGLILNLLIDGPAPRLHGLGFAAAPSIPTIFVAGDSTVCDWDPVATNILDPLQRGWAQEFSQYLNAGIAVANYADSGETAGGFYTKFFPPARTAMKTGDYLFIQFGHNDQKAAADITNYQANLMRYITDARTKGATPVLFTPVARKGASIAAPGFAGLDQEARALATAQNVALVDLTTLAINYYRTVANVASLFATPTEGTHFSETGATQIANLVAQALKAGALPLKTFVK